ncbi:hypothetical protein OC844_002203 [Tilletia horrida]|nr:hypothetical protein OC844_002203 [Tilletia horrida]
MSLPLPHELTTPLSTTAPTPIRFGFPQAAIDRIAAQLADARLPSQPILDGVGWQYGTDLSKLRQLVDAWSKGNPAGAGARGSASADGSAGASGGSGGSAQGFAAWWRTIEGRINETAQHYLVEIEGLRIHFQMRKSESPNAIPLIFSHGWPGSFYEAHKLFPLLTEDSSPSFHLVVPSLPGYGLSSAQTKPDWTLLDTARVFNKLMVSILGFSSYAAHGGDLGALVVRGLARNKECTAFHSNFAPPVNIPPWAYPALGPTFLDWSSNISDTALSLVANPHEIRLIKASIRYRKTGSAYAFEHSTKPATLGYALLDNPIGILSWLLQCFHEWSDPRAPAFHDGHAHSRTSDQIPGSSGIVQGDGVGKKGSSAVRLGVSNSSEPMNRTSAITDETILVNATIYALTDTVHTSFLPYYESEHMWGLLGRDKEWTRDLRDKPYGHSSFPYELLGGPRSWIPRTGVNLVWYREHNEGGHFAALDNPEGLARDLKDFFSRFYSPA